MNARGLYKEDLEIRCKLQDDYNQLYGLKLSNAKSILETPQKSILETLQKSESYHF